MTIYECLNCHIPFKSSIAKKFHDRDCYTAYRQTHTSEEIQKLLPKRVGETTTSGVVVDDHKISDTTPLENISDKQNDDIDFDDLSLNQIQEVMVAMSERNLQLIEDVKQLRQELKDDTTRKLKQLVDDFVKDVEQVTTIQPVHVQVCPACGREVTSEKIFCDDACARSVLPKFGRMMMSDGRMISK